MSTKIASGMPSYETFRINDLPQRTAPEYDIEFMLQQYFLRYRIGAVGSEQASQITQ
jgi:hypothetical protein